MLAGCLAPEALDTFREQCRQVALGSFPGTAPVPSIAGRALLWVLVVVMGSWDRVPCPEQEQTVGYTSGWLGEGSRVRRTS